SAQAHLLWCRDYSASLLLFILFYAYPFSAEKSLQDESPDCMALLMMYGPIEEDKE
ncbi:hypothetical protein SK128_017604, partial [Halocaridina rubra]